MPLSPGKAKLIKNWLLLGLAREAQRQVRELCTVVGRERSGTEQALSSIDLFGQERPESQNGRP